LVDTDTRALLGHRYLDEQERNEPNAHRELDRSWSWKRRRPSRMAAKSNSIV
jgi:hypothetical protein